VTDEAASLLRISAFAFVVSFVYGFLTKEFLGTWGFIALNLGPGFAGLLLYFEARKRMPDPDRETLGGAFWRFAGLPRMDPMRRQELAADDLAVIPSPSVWPFVLSIATAVMATGLVFGAWLLLLGGVLFVWGAWGWIAAANRETSALERRGVTGPTGGSLHH
jgi:Cytochrome c oxidase subunit IV